MGYAQPMPPFGLADNLNIENKKKPMQRPDIEKLVEQIQQGLPPEFATLQEDVEKNLRAAIQSALRKLDLVTRDEFDIQQQVLERTQERLQLLEKRLGELEKQQLK